MTEATAHRILMIILTIVSAICILSLLLASLDGKLEAHDFIYTFINMGFFWKLYLGMKRYLKAVKLKKIERSGWALLNYSLFKFY